jgi:hypothetical protein
LTAAAQALGRATALTPRRFRRPAAGWDSVWVLAVGFAAVAAMTLGSTVAERSWVEGAFRGCFEVVAFAFGWLGLGRVLGLRHSAA